jgi:tRNA nucleotidyltransferase/poly(A) polymerase
MLAGMEGGALVGGAIGSVVPVLGNAVGAIVGGLIGGFIGYQAGVELQNAVGPAMVSKETMDALNTQVAYERQNNTVAYGVGEAIPQFLAFKPSPAALKGAWNLMGRVAVAPSVAAKVNLIKMADSEVKNQLFMIALGSTIQANQARQEFEAGTFNPTLFAINLASATMLSQPRKLLQAVSPTYRVQMARVLKVANEEMGSGVAQGLQQIQAMAGDRPEHQAMANAAIAQYDKIGPLIEARKGPEAMEAIKQFLRMQRELVDAYNGAVKPVEPAAPIPPQSQNPVNFDRFNRTIRGRGPVPPATPPAKPFDEFNRVVQGNKQRVVNEGNFQGRQNPLAQSIPSGRGAWWRHGDQWDAYPPHETVSPELEAESKKLAEQVASGQMSPEQADQYAHENGLPDWYTPADGMTHPYVPEKEPLRAIGEQYTRPDPFDPNALERLGIPRPGLDPKFAAAAAKVGPSSRAQLEADIKAAQSRNQKGTDKELSYGRELSKEFPPEPRKETTPLGVSIGIRIAVENSPAANAAFQALSPLGDVHVVGGAVRDMILGKPLKDLDLTFSGSEEELQQALSTIGDAEVQKTGEKFPVFRVNVEGDQVEIALHRTENPENQNSFATGKDIPIHEDLGRRDFTFNSMAVNVKTGELIDPHNGLKSAQSKTLALVNPLAFAGDPIRMLRALRFIGDGFHANKSLLESMKENAALLSDVPPERIQTELDRIFSSEKPGKALEAMKDSGVLDHIFPEHLKTVGFDQRSTHHNQLLWDHIMGVVDKTAELNSDPDVRMAAFLHDISKPDTQTPRPDGRMSYLGHEDVGAETSKRILTSLKYSNDRIDKIVFLVKNHMFAQARVLAHPAGFIHDMSKDLMAIPVEDRRVIVDQRIKDLMDIRKADQANHPVNRMDIEGMKKALDAIGHKPIERPASNINGNDLIDLGLKPGPQFREILSRLDDEVLYQNLPNEPETLLARAKELADIKVNPLMARKMVPHDEDPWPATRRAILDYGGIGPSRDWPRDMIPGDLYRADGKAPDMVAIEAKIGRASIPPWGENVSDQDMMTYLRRAWEQHVKFQQQEGAYQPAEVVPDRSGHVNQMSRASGVRGPNAEVRNVAQQYAIQAGLRPPTETPPVTVNPEKAKRLASFYEKAQSDPTNPQVQAAYEAFNAETQAQWDAATQAGYRFEAWDQPGQPYRNSAEMRADVLNNKHLYYFKTSEGQAPHELMTPEQNDRFRAVHDFFGHAMNGNEFGANGEENAWAEHAKMYSPLAQKAMTTETRAQNSVVNFGEHGEANRANPAKTIYPDQKAILPPSEFLPGQPMKFTHWSAQARKFIDPEHQGESDLSSEIAHSGPNTNKAARFASYYEEGRSPERFFGPGTPFPVKHTVTGDFKILDMNSTEGRALQAEVARKNIYGVRVPHELDDALQAAGYDGYKYGDQGTTRMFGKQPVSHVNDLPVTPQEGQSEFTARLGPGQEGRSFQTAKSVAPKVTTIEEPGRIRVFVDGKPAGVAQQGQGRDRPEHWTEAGNKSGRSTLDKSRIVSDITDRYVAKQKTINEAQAAAQYDNGIVGKNRGNPEAMAAELRDNGYKVNKIIDEPIESGYILPNGLGVDLGSRYVTEHSGEMSDLFGSEGEWGGGRDGSKVGAIGVHGNYAGIGEMDVKTADTLTNWAIGLAAKGRDSIRIASFVDKGRGGNRVIEYTIPMEALKKNGFDIAKAAKEYAGTPRYARKAQGEINGLQQESTRPTETGSQVGDADQERIPGEASTAGQVGGEDFAQAADQTNVTNPEQVTASTERQASVDFDNRVEGNNGSAEPGAIYPPTIGAGDVRANAGDEARAAGATIHAPRPGFDETGRPATSSSNDAAFRIDANGRTTFAPDFTPESFAARNREAAQQGTLASDEAAKGGNARWRSSSDVEPVFIQAVTDKAAAFGVNMTDSNARDYVGDVPFRGGVRLSNLEHGETERFANKPNNEGKVASVPLRKDLLVIPDDPALIPEAVNKPVKWETQEKVNRLVDLVRAHGQGDPTLEYLPAKITDDAGRVALVLKGWTRRFFYENARAFPGSDNISFLGLSPGAQARWAAFQPVFGDKASVIMNGRNTIAHFARMESGVFKNSETGEMFDPQIFQDLVDAGIIKQYGKSGISLDNLVGAAKGFLSRTLKIGDYAGAMNGEARAPVDMWEARINFGVDSTPTTKMYEYGFGRNNFITRMFSAHDPSILPSHIQSAEWFGYQSLVSERIAAIKQAALATGDPAIIKLAGGIRTNLESRDLAETFREYFGLTNKSQPPTFAIDKILGNPKYRESLIAMSKEFFTRRYLKGQMGAPTRKGGSKDVLDLQQGGAVYDAAALLRQTPGLRSELAKYYKQYFVDAKTLRAGPGAARQSLDRNVGPVMERIMEIAYAHDYPGGAQQLGREAFSALTGLVDVSPVERQFHAAKYVVKDAVDYLQRKHDLGNSLVEPLAQLQDQFNLPQGLVGIKISYDGSRDGAYMAQYNPDEPNIIEINARHFTYMGYIREDLASYLTSQITLPQFKDLKGAALEKVRRVIRGYQTGDESSISRLLLGHELAHVIQDRIYGKETLWFNFSTPDHLMLQSAVSMLEHMTPKYMSLLVREGLGNEMEALLRAHSTSINEYLGGTKPQGFAENTMPLNQAITNLLEHQAHQWTQFQKLPHSEYSWATAETYRRNIYEPEIAEASYKELGKIYEKAIKALDDSLAVEAESQLSGRGPNPAIDKELPSADETGAGPAAYAKLSEADALHPDSSGWTNAKAPNQDLAQELTTGQRAESIKAAADDLRVRMADPEYKPVYGDRQALAELTAVVNELNAPKLPVVTDPWLAKTTAQAVARIERLPGEGDRGFAQRMVKASGAYNNLDHALAVASAARDGGSVPVRFGDKVGFKIDGKFYSGVPSDHVEDWAPGFHDAVHNVLDGVPEGAKVGEPSATGVGSVSGEQLRSSLADEFRAPTETRIAPNARVGAVNITNKAGEEIPVPSFAPHHFLMAKNADMPSSKLSAGSAANKAKAHFEEAAQGIKLTEEFTNRGLFDPAQTEAVYQAEEAAAAAAGGGGDEPPVPPGGGEPPIGEGGKQPKGPSPDEREAERVKAEILRSADVLRDYMSALKDSLALEDPAHHTITAGINDLIVQAMKTFNTSEAFKDSRTWAVDATYAMKSLAKQYDRVGDNITKRITALEVKSPGANDRIRAVQHAASPEARDALLKGYSDEEKYLANHLHNYWKMLGDVLTRAGMTKSAVENYFPLLVERGNKQLGDRGIQTSRYTQRTTHAIAKLKNEDGSYRFETPEDLQEYVDGLSDKKTGEALDWKVRTGVGDVFKIQGIGVTRALTAKHAIDQMVAKSEVQVGKTRGEVAPAILTPARMRDNEIASTNIDRYVRSSQMIGKWRSALTHSYWKGDQRVEEDYWVHRDIANIMEREATWAEMPGDVVTSTAKTIAHYNQLFKKYQFFLTPMHEWSLLGNLTAHAGWNPIGVHKILDTGNKIVNDPAMGETYSLLTRAGGSDEFGPLTGIETHIPGYEWYHDLIWKKTMYNGTYGLGHKIMQEHLAARAAQGVPITPEERFDAAKVGMRAAKQAMGSITNIDMSNNWRLWGNVIFLANRWTTGQLRTIGEAIGFKRLANMGGGVALEGHDAGSTRAMQARSQQMSQRLLTGGLIRLAIVGTALSSGVSALLNNGVPSTPFDNFQKDPARTFDIYAGRDASGKDQWFRMPFYLFQREMVDWVMSAVKANNEGKDFINTKNLGDSAALAPFVHFAGKLDPVTKAALESLTGQELNGWMRGYSTANIDADPQIQNLNKSLQLMGFGDGGSLENRLLNAIRSLWPASGFPRKLDTPTADYGAIAGALGLGIGPLSLPDPTGRLGSSTNIALGMVGSGQLGGITNKPGPDGTIQPAWKNANYYKEQDKVGQSIMQIASTLGTGTKEEELDKLQKMEDLRVSVGLTPASLTNLILHGSSLPTGEKGVLAEGAAPRKTVNKAFQPTVLSGVTLTPAQETAYNAVTFQRQMQALEQLMSDPTWKTMDATERSNAMSSLKAFADRITNEQFSIAIGVKRGPVVTTPQASSMIAEFGMVKRATQNGLLQSSIYMAAKPEAQKIMMTDRVSSAENAVWQKYYGVGALKGASDETLTTYVNLQSNLKDETRMLVEKLPSYSRSLDPYAKKQMLDLSLAFADNLVNQAVQGKSPKAFGTPLTQTELIVAVRNGVVLQDASLKNLHGSFIYQEANQADQLALDNKYATLAHNIALYDTRMGIQEGIGQNAQFNSILNTSLAADEGYAMLVEQFFGTGGKLVLAQREKELADLKARFEQENAVRPADLSKYDTLINNWYKQQNPDYANFLYYRSRWEKYDPVGQAYVAMGQANYGYESLNPLALSTP